MSIKLQRPILGTVYRHDGDTLVQRLWSLRYLRGSYPRNLGSSPQSNQAEQTMKQAALGFRAHSGWTALVALFVERNEPQVLMRERPKLVQKFTYEFRQPYHTAENMPVGKAQEFVSHVESIATQLAEAAIRSIQTDLQKRGYEVACFALPLASARPLPSLEKILLSHALVHTADGELFRRALIRAGERCHLAAFRLVERDLVTAGCSALNTSKDDLLRRLAAVGKPVGAPWSQDEKFATLAAWLALLHYAGQDQPNRHTVTGNQ